MASLSSVFTEHLPDLVSSQTSTRATFYQETPYRSTNPQAPPPKPNHPRNFLALYQTDFEECLKTQNYTTLRTTSDLFEGKGGAKSNSIQDNGDFDARNYSLIQEYDPKVAPPEILTVEMHPTDVEDFENWYRQEHLELLAKVPGYRRTLRYKLGPQTPLTKEDGHESGIVPAYLAVHEVDDVLKAFGGKEAQAANTTAWSQKHFKDSKVFVVRGWKMVHQEGF